MFLRSSGIDRKIPLLRTVNGQKAFSYHEVKFWNGLERELLRGNLPVNSKESEECSIKSIFPFFSYFIMLHTVL